MRQSVSFSSNSQVSLGLKRKASSPLSSADAPDDDQLDSQLTTTTTTTTTSPNASQSKATSTPSKPKTRRKTSSKQSGIKPNGEDGSTKATGSDVPLLLAWNGMPTNKALPPVIDFPPKKEGIRIVAWNVCGLASAIKKGFFHYLAAENPDILILTETKMKQRSADPTLTERFPHQYWSVSEKKGYAGTAILSKIAPLTVKYDLPGYDNPSVVTGRIITLEFDKFWLIGTYVPNAGAELKALDIKNAWNAAFEAYIHNLDKTKPVIWAGDLNVAPTAKDIKNDKTNWNKSAGYTADECSAFSRILENHTPSSAESLVVLESSIDVAASGSSVVTAQAATITVPSPKPGRLLDIWRETHPDDEHYTYFSFRFNCRAKQIGWRLDMFVLSERIRHEVKMCEIRYEIFLDDTGVTSNPILEEMKFMEPQIIYQ